MREQTPGPSRQVWGCWLGDVNNRTRSQPSPELS